MFYAEYGTGKTLLLVHKAAELLKRREKVLFIVFVYMEGDHPACLLDHLQQQFDKIVKDNKLDKNLLTLKTDGITSFSKLLVQNVNNQHVFVDELDDYHRIKNKGYLESSMSKYFWIAMSADVYHLEMPDEKEDEVHCLRKVFRNQPNIIRYLKLHNDVEVKDEMDRNNPPVVTIFYEG